MESKHDTATCFESDCTCCCSVVGRTRTRALDARTSRAPLPLIANSSRLYKEVVSTSARATKHAAAATTPSPRASVYTLIYYSVRSWRRRRRRCATGSSDVMHVGRVFASPPTRPTPPSTDAIGTSGRAGPQGSRHQCHNSPTRTLLPKTSRVRCCPAHPAPSCCFTSRSRDFQCRTYAADADMAANHSVNS